MTALFSNTTGDYNTAYGSAALATNTTGIWNTAIGWGALNENSVGNYNTAVGLQALFSNTTGSNNTASGLSALYDNTTGSDNTANGVNALISNTVGNNNTAQGSATLSNNTSGIENTASGFAALNGNTTGHDNTASGVNALIGNTIGSNNIALGAGAGGNLTTGSNNIDIGNAGVAAESGIIRIGTSGTQSATFIAGIRGVAVAGGQPVGVNANGQLGVRASSARFKEAIKPMDKASEAILSLQPVTFRYKKELDPGAVPQFGLVAEEVEKVNPDLVARDAEGKPYTVRYEAVNAMLLNEFLKEHKAFLEEHRTVQDLKAAVAQQQKRIEALTTGLQKVSAEVEMSHPAPQTVLNSR